MERSHFSPNWYRVAALRPRLRSHVAIHRQQFRGRIWYVLQEGASGRHHRFTPAAYLVISLMDGRRSVDEIWDAACASLGEEAPTQDDVIRLLAQLHQSDLLHGDVRPDVAEVSRRGRRMRLRKLLAGMLNPLAVRVPLMDPDRFLNATYPAVGWLLTRFGALLFLASLGYALSLAAIHWDELTGNVTDRLLAAESLLLLVLTYPVVKALHEFGHGYAVKKWGGEVHEIGVMFLVFMPVPYVDASAAAAFRDKWSRALVGAMGIIVELFLAAVAMMVWVEVEEGLLRGFAFSVMLIGGVSTLLFNGNPLLRFDGYYVLSDLLEIPNLGNRANRYVGYLVQRHAFGVATATSPATAPGEAPWMFCYALASFAYRIVITVTIVLYVSSRFFVLGIVLAFWALLLMVVLPIGKSCWFLVGSPALRQRRGRALAVTATALAGLSALLLAVPLPHATVAEGVLWLPDEATVHVRSAGTVTTVLRPPGAAVTAGEPLAVLEDPTVDAQVALAEARLAQVRARLEAAQVEDRAEARLFEEQMRQARAELALQRERRRDLTVLSPSDGRFVVAGALDLVGSHFDQGAAIGYVVRQSDPVVRVIVPEADADLVRRRTRSVGLRLADDPARTVAASLLREVPALTDRLPAAALSTVGGGAVMLDPTSPEQARALDRMLQLDLRLLGEFEPRGFGGRVHVRFDHGWEPLAWRLVRGLRQLLLEHFNV